MTVFAPGMMVTPHVRLVRKLGQGGMGTVWVAAHLRLDSEVAVKFIDPLLIQQHPAMKSRFRLEATAAAKINSPHVVRTFDHGEMDDGTPFIVMELLEGESLADRLDGWGPLGLRETETVIVQMCKLLRIAHKLGIVHRDIKPGNLFLVGAHAGAFDDEPSGRSEELFVKILDFGIAKEVHREGSLLTLSGTMLGTPEYMSPEHILSSKDVDFQTDLWAVAVVAYECLTGSLPFRGDTLGGVIMAVCSGKFTLPSQVPGGPSPLLDAWFQRAFALDSGARFGSARELANSFADAVGALTGAPRAEGPLSRSLPGVFQRPHAVPPGPSGPTTAATWSDATLLGAVPQRSPGSRRKLGLGLGVAAVVVGSIGFAFVSGGPKAVAPADTAAARDAPVTGSATIRDAGTPPPARATAAPTSQVLTPGSHPNASGSASLAEASVAEASVAERARIAAPRPAPRVASPSAAVERPLPAAAPPKTSPPQFAGPQHPPPAPKNPTNF